MKKILLLGLSIACLSTPALAISRYNALALTCQAANDAVIREHAVIFRYPAERTSMTLYDRFVDGTLSCSPGFVAQESYVPTRDTPNCRLLSCRWINEYEGNMILFPHP